MATPKLFQPITYKNCTLKNRIVVSPMCMYAVEEKTVKPRLSISPITRAGQSDKPGSCLWNLLQ